MFSLLYIKSSIFFFHTPYKKYVFRAVKEKVAFMSGLLETEAQSPTIADVTDMLIVFTQ